MPLVEELTATVIRKLAIHYTIQEMDQFGFAEQGKVTDAVWNQVRQAFGIPSRLRKFMRRKVCEEVSDQQRAQSCANKDGVRYRRWGKCEHVDRDGIRKHFVVDMIEGPVKLVRKCLDLMAEGIRRDVREFVNTALMVNEACRKKGVREYEIPEAIYRLYQEYSHGTVE